MKTVPSLGLKTQELRLRAGISQEELAVKAWVSRKWLNEFENGKPSVSASKVLDVLQALGYEVDVVPIETDERER